jgi:RNA 3'-terminal phosphate cyclase (ATP)
MEILKHGIFPIGQGRVLFNTFPSKTIDALNITERGKLKKVMIRVVSTNNFSIVNIKQLYNNIIKDVKKLVKNYKKNIEKTGEQDEDQDHENNSGLFQEDFVDISEMKKGNTLFSQIVLYFENTILSAENTYSDKKEKIEIKNFKSELLIKFEDLLKNEKVCLDEFTVDHLIIFMASAKGKSVIHVGEVSLHTLTAIEITKKFIPTLNVNISKLEEFTKIEIEGIGYTNDL